MQLYDENIKTKTLQCHAFGEVDHNIANLHQDELVTVEALLRAPKLESLTFICDKTKLSKKSKDLENPKCTFILNSLHG